VAGVPSETIVELFYGGFTTGAKHELKIECREGVHQHTQLRGWLARLKL
jgi:hypothetical protein